MTRDEMICEEMSRDPTFRAAYEYVHGKEALERVHGKQSTKDAFVPAPGMAQAAQPGMPPGMPPGMDPAMMGGMAGGMPPGMDPSAMMGGMAGGMPPTMDPSAMAGGTPAQAPAPAAPAPAPDAAGGAGPGASPIDQLKAAIREVMAENQGGKGQGGGGKGQGGKADLNAMVQNLATDVYQMRHAFNAVAEHLGIPVKIPDLNRDPASGLPVQPQVPAPTGPAPAATGGGGGGGGGSTGGGGGGTPKSAGEFDLGDLVHDFGRPVASPVAPIVAEDPDGTAMAAVLSELYLNGGGRP